MSKNFLLKPVISVNSIKDLSKSLKVNQTLKSNFMKSKILTAQRMRNMSVGT